METIPLHHLAPLSEKGEGNGTEQGLGGVEGNDLEQGLGGGGANDLEQDLVEEGESANMPPLDEPSPYLLCSKMMISSKTRKTMISPSESCTSTRRGDRWGDGLRIPRIELAVLC